MIEYKVHEISVSFGITIITNNTDTLKYYL